MEIEQFETKADFLAQCAKMLAEKHPRSSSYCALSKRVGIPRSTFERIAKKEVQSPSFHNALKVVQSVCEDGKVKDFMEKFYPEMREEFERVYPSNSDLPFVPPEVEEFFTNALTYEMMLFISSFDNLTLEDLEKRFGDKGKPVLEKLMGSKAVKVEDGKVIFNGPVNMEQSAVHRLFLQLANNNYDVQSFGKTDNWLSLQYHSVDMEKVMPQLREICRKASEEAWEVLKDSGSRGDDLIWFGMVMDGLFPQGTPPLKEETSEGEIIQ